jgi:hypothetical protein
MSLLVEDPLVWLRATLDEMRSLSPIAILNSREDRQRCPLKGARKNWARLCSSD